jgi:hypothetical protein
MCFLTRAIKVMFPVGARVDRLASIPLQKIRVEVFTAVILLQHYLGLLSVTCGT